MGQSSNINYPYLVDNNENKTLLISKDKCDKYDYLAAIVCGAIGGLIDIFLVGTPGNSPLGNWTDQQIDNSVKSFAKLVGWNPSEAQQNNVSSAIGFLERKYRINYDQRYSNDVGNAFKMTTKNHHIMSLSHSPDIVGLFFSILNQFTSTSSFIANGQIITIQTETFELRGSNFISKLFCGIANWFGHIMSDIAGSSGSKTRGSGISIPFFELFQFCKFGRFKVDNDIQDLATISKRVFQEGYDFRFGLAMAIPVVLTDLSIRLIWSIRRYFQYQMPLKECIPTQQHADLRVMLLFGNGTLCVMDGIDAGLRSGGNCLSFFTRLNLIAWFRFVTLVLKEVCIRVGITDALQKSLNAFQKVNEVLLEYLKELEKIDIQLFIKETNEYNQFVNTLISAKTDAELNIILLNAYEKLGIEKPWQGDFGKHMSDKNAKLVFK